MKSALSVAFLAASAQASSRWWPSAHTDSLSDSCAHIAGVYQWTETLNEYASGAYQPVGSPQLGNEANTCVGALALFQIKPNCDWFLKRLRNDPIALDPTSIVIDDHSCASDNTGESAEQIDRSEAEFWSFPTEVGKSFAKITFTIEHVINFAGSGKRIQGIIEKENGCNLAFEGWRIQHDADLTHCKQGYINGQYHVGNALLKRKAQLTSEDTSSVSVSDIKDALALIANHIPDWDETSTGDSGTSDSDRPKSGDRCHAIAGVYQVKLDNNEFDDSEVLRQVGIPASTFDQLQASEKCSNMVGYLDIHPSCDYSSKFIRPHLREAPVPIPFREDTLCIDDAGGWEDNGICAFETEFWFYWQDTMSNPFTPPAKEVNSKFKLAINRIHGSGDHGPVFLSGIYEYHTKRGESGEGCDYTISGWKTSRTQIFPCRDVDYSTPAPTAP